MDIKIFLNKPLIVLLIGVSYYFLLQNYVGKTSLQKEMLEWSAKLQAISKGGPDDELIKFRKSRDNIAISDLGRGISTFKNKEKFIGVINNNSKYPVTKLKVTVACYSPDGKLIDVASTRLSDIKLLTPGESVTFLVERNLGDHSLSAEELSKRKAATFAIQLVSFEVRELEE